MFLYCAVQYARLWTLFIISNPSARDWPINLQGDPSFDITPCYPFLRRVVQ